MPAPASSTAAPQEWNPTLMVQQMMMMQNQLNQMMTGMAPPVGFGSGGLGSSGPSASTGPQMSVLGAGPQLMPGQFQKLVGPTPSSVDQWQWNRWYDGDRGDKDQVPKWDGRNPAKTLKSWLRDLRIWRQETSVPVQKHGLKLYRSFEPGSWLKTTAERIPEETLFSADAWELILKEILINLKPFLDVEMDVLIEETVTR